eukprot:CAMPEP_0114638308 /NCGR_PEP_ID=MMETSP0191-20121206/551_1 /TAXON_ID=126664 /ORGANISM="Sorites sp." /LENGTH=250 /DNA_ID=CAMNT_0001850067 /DNA_START=13 /DNA_END=765 /DNA_ORIENTATION=-
MRELWPSRPGRESFGSVALRPCSPLLSDAGTLQAQRARSLGSLVQPANQPKFAKTTPNFGSVMLRARTPTAGVLWENTRAETQAAELDRVLKADLTLQDKAQGLKFGPETDINDAIESGLREEQFHKDVVNVTTQLEYLTKRSRLEHLLWDDKVKEDRRAEGRKLRQRERMARDPHRKLAQKVEDRRRLGWENWANQSIPVHQVEVGGGTVGMVDVTGLKARSKLSGNVDALLQQRRKERTRPASVAWPM